MSILADHEIRDLCVLPAHLTNFEAYLNNLDAQSPLGDDASRLAVVKKLMPDLNPFAAKRTFGDAPEWIRKVVADFTELLEPYSKPPMIEPYFDDQVREIRRRIKWQDDEHETSRVKVVSYGVSSFGYDARLGREIKTFTNINGGVIDPKNFDKTLCVKPEIFEDDYGSEYIIVPSNGFVLGTTMEYFRIPRDVQTICLGKSTYARTGLVVNVTPLEAEWEGNVTIELSNTTPLPIMVYLEEGICQFLFFRGEKPCDVSYADRSGKYQGQQGVTLPKV